MNEIQKNIERKIHIVESDYNRPRFHIVPKIGFINDPNGLIYYRGEYHVFYQWNPFFPENRKVYWGHMKSRDLIHWEELETALSPDMWYDRNGCYSGSAIEVNKKFYLIYTGNVKDEDGNRETYQCGAVSKDGRKFSKLEKNPLVKNQPEGYMAHFRDPKVFRKNGDFYFVLGAQNTQLKGRVVLYKSDDLFHWKIQGEMKFKGIDAENFGYMWECPNLFQLEDEKDGMVKDILMFCPQGLEPSGMLYNNIYQCGYITGKIEEDNLTFANCRSFEEIDRGFEFYAPQIFNDGKKTIMIGWMGNPEEEEQPSRQYSWMHCLAIPRELNLKNGRIYQKPVAELKSLRKDSVEIRNLIVENSIIKLHSFDSDVYEMKINFDVKHTEKLTLYLRCSENKFVSVEFQKDILTVDRSHTDYILGGTRSVRLPHNDTLKLQIFSDRSSLEIFVNDGQEVFSLRAYMGDRCLDTKVEAHGKVSIVNAVYYRI
ncbi:sucrose-6-phosphate hydrolase [Clostridium tyrobutyricum]|uniref:glycoside hydrolase family 32 protein n=1 Tax=Clostridium tyrobutyricum TaxID=1519 RepID=UPI001C3953C7|nr:sucrose-6-phosphate hydrolase [Clostridium tyrobutyricum]MBV4418421.1 sucrose-6-phosphate hydrolase [Clostridium tyrobutyricum]